MTVQLFATPLGNCLLALMKPRFLPPLKHAKDIDKQLYSRNYAGISERNHTKKRCDKY